ncbi:myogenesis-regulating glycosidase-like [Glandiceps talaboti]
MIRNDTETTLVRDTDSQSDHDGQVKFDVVSVESGISSGESERQKSAEETSHLVVRLKVPVPPDRVSLNSSSFVSDYHSDSSSEADYGLPIRRLKTPREIKLKLFVAFLLIVIIVNVTVIWILHIPKPLTFHLGHATISDFTKLSLLYDGNIVLEGRFAGNLPDTVPFSCLGKLDKHNNRLCLLWKGHVKLNATYTHYKESGTECYNIEWNSLNQDYKPNDCFSMSTASWYGGGEMYNQKWPINSCNVSTTPFVSTDLRYNKEGFGSVLEPYWLSSQGVAIYVDDNSPLHVSLNHVSGDELCLQANYDNSMYMYTVPENKLSTLKYTICTNSNIKTTHQFIVQQYFQTPKEYPSESIFQLPVWSTTHLYPDANQSLITNYAEQIQEYSFNCSQFIIDDGYLLRYGDFDFNPSRFPDPSDMFDTLHGMGLNTILWMHPFANTDSNAFSKGLVQGYWIRGPRDSSPALTQWWNGIAASVLDVTYSKAVIWFTEKLNTVKQKYGVKSFQFVGGEVSWLPPVFSTHQPLSHPSEFTTLFAAIASSFGTNTQIKAAYHSQTLPVFLSMTDKESEWNSTNGLQSIIPTILTYSIMGYPFVIPDVIGGHGNDSIPDKELYIRWLELTAFLPVMHFSTPPWFYEMEVIELSRHWVGFHENVIAPKLLVLAREYLLTGDPVIRPLWWENPSDQTTFDIDTEFLIGSDTLVAPILKKGVFERQVYLPNGSWKNELSKETVGGGKWINVQVPINKVAYFTKL